MILLLEIIDFCESTIDEVMGRNNLDYGMCEFYRGVICLYPFSACDSRTAPAFNADAVFHAVMNENPDNDYSKSTARYLYSLYMRWGKKELAEQYKKNTNQHALGIAITMIHIVRTHPNISITGNEVIETCRLGCCPLLSIFAR